MGTLEAILLGLLQGLTEFLPVSSSGHLVIAQHFLGITLPGVTFEVMVHFGTLLSIIWVFRKDLYRLIAHFSEMEEKKLLFSLIFATIPTGLMGLFFSSFFREIFDKPLFAGLMLLVTGFIVIAIQKINLGNRKIKEMSPWDAVLIGVFQGIAIVPGITRSGSTILGALWRGLKKEEAIRFSFLLALPAIAGAMFLEILGLFKSGDLVHGFLSYNFIGALTAFFSGIFAITVFIKLLMKEKFYYLAYYCWLAGILTLLFAG
ncbi:MAG: undecaprenyl-diphosphate phosphatase [Dethiobacteria bacterium]|jgi:undecaprenyl-diphosphatase